MLVASDTDMEHTLKDLAFYKSDAGLDYPIAISYSFLTPAKPLLLTRFPVVDFATSYTNLR